MPRARKPFTLHELAGTTPEWNGDTPSFRVGRPKRPKNLPVVADEEWKRITRELSKRGTLTTVDSSALEVYVRLYAQWRSYCDEVDKYGAMIEEEILDKNGEVHTRRVPNPAGKYAIQLGNAVRQYQKEFSATPASREKTKPGVAPPPKNTFPPGSMGDMLQHPDKYQEVELGQSAPPADEAGVPSLDWPEAPEESPAEVAGPEEIPTGGLKL